MRHLLAALVALLACVHRAAPPPDIARERRAAETRACFEDRLPPWLDDEALAEAERIDRWGASGRDPNDGWRISGGAAYTADVPARRPSDASGGSRATAILEQRREFRARCDVLRTSGHGPALPPVR